MTLRARLTAQKSGFFVLELSMGSPWIERTSKKSTCMLSFSQPRQCICLPNTKIHQEYLIVTDTVVSPVRKQYGTLENIHRHRKHPMCRIIWFPLNNANEQFLLHGISTLYKHNLRFLFYSGLWELIWALSPKEAALQHCWFFSGDAEVLLHVALTCNPRN